MNYPKHILAVGSLVRNQSGQVLLVKTRIRGWELPGGQVDKGEDTTSALIREVLEEAGIIITPRKLAAIYSSIDDPSKLIIDFLVDYTEGTPKQSDETVDVSWFTPEDALTNVKNDIMSYRLRWLLHYKGGVRHATFSKNPFKVFTETLY